MWKNTLAPAELFDYRLAVLLGYTDVNKMKRSMSYRAYLGWQKYWNSEPWGPVRDNFHAALIAFEVRKLANPKTRVKLETFMWKSPEEQVAKAKDDMMMALGAMATKVTPKEAHRRMKAMRERRGRKKVKRVNRKKL